MKFLSSTLFIAPLCLCSTPNAAVRPNIVIFVADDLGWADVRFRGSPIETPNLDRLAAEGMELERFYTTPICSPTRAAPMTGRDPIRLGSLCRRAHYGRGTTHGSRLWQWYVSG